MYSRVQNFVHYYLPSTRIIHIYTLQGRVSTLRTVQD